MARKPKRAGDVVAGVVAAVGRLGDLGQGPGRLDGATRRCVLLALGRGARDGGRRVGDADALLREAVAGVIAPRDSTTRCTCIFLMTPRGVCERSSRMS